MTEITRVPLRPIKKGSLTKLWLGVIVAILLGAGLAWAAVPKGVEVETLTEGVGPSPQIGDVVFANYVGTLPDGTEFDRSQPSPFPPEVFPAGTPFPLEEEGGLIQGFVLWPDHEQRCLMQGCHRRLCHRDVGSGGRRGSGRACNTRIGERHLYSP